MISFKDLIAVSGTTGTVNRDDLTYNLEKGNFVLGTHILKELGTLPLSVYRFRDNSEIVLLADMDGKICKAKTRKDGTTMNRSGTFTSAKLKKLITEYFPGIETFNLSPLAIEDFDLPAWTINLPTTTPLLVVDENKEEEEDLVPAHAIFTLNNEL